MAALVLAAAASPRGASPEAEPAAVVPEVAVPAALVSVAAEAVSLPVPPPPPQEARRYTVEGPVQCFRGRALHKRTYGNRLVFLDIRVIPESGAETEDCEVIEVVFDFEVYGSEVRVVRKDIVAGDIVSFQGRARTEISKTGARVLEATSYAVVERWTDHNTSQFVDAVAKTARSALRQRGFPCNRADKPSGETATGKRLFCKMWLNNHMCSREDCSCDHPEGEALKEARRQYSEARRARNLEIAVPEDPHHLDNKRFHSQRADVFAEWLCSVYGLETLRSRGVVEVAGGKGELAFELSVKRGVPCTVVDPRCPGNGSGMEATLDARPARWKGWRLGRLQRAWLEANVPGISGFDACQAYIETCQLFQCKAAVTAECATESEGATRSFWEAIVGNGAVVVGLHPDQATGGVVELALAFGLPFAVVPCCTFADDFPERVLADERPVRTYDDLVAWLRLQNPSAEVGFLGFRGKNLVVFTQSPVRAA